MGKIAIYPGSFDPITNGHIDVIERASELFDKIVVVIAINSKKKSLFTDEEKMEMAKTSLKKLENVEVDYCKTLIVDYAENLGASAIIRGVRAVTDFEYEFQMALMNRKLSPKISTLFLIPNEKYSYLNSTIVRELARYGEIVKEFVPSIVAKKLKEKRFD